MPTPGPGKTADSPLWLFLTLEAAVLRGDHAGAAEAQRRLARLGVYVRYSLPRRRREVARASS
jgi:hypothetical protein